jgi:hypothetical protein
MSALKLSMYSVTQALSSSLVCGEMTTFDGVAGCQQGASWYSPPKCSYLDYCLHVSDVLSVWLEGWRDDALRAGVLLGCDTQSVGAPADGADS